VSTDIEPEHEIRHLERQFRDAVLRMIFWAMFYLVFVVGEIVAMWIKEGRSPWWLLVLWVCCYWKACMVLQERVVERAGQAKKFKTLRDEKKAER